MGKKPHPGERPTLVLFVLGGISFKEMQEIHEQLEKFRLKNVRIVVLSTHVVNAESILHLVYS